MLLDEEVLSLFENNTKQTNNESIQSNKNQTEAIDYKKKLQELVNLSNEIQSNITVEAEKWNLESDLSLLEPMHLIKELNLIE